MHQQVDDFIAHYASEFYSPEKAHEYYLKTRKLKAKASSTALTSDAQKKAFAVAKDSIGTARTNDLNQAVTDSTAEMEAAKANAQAAAERIQAKLSDFLDQISSDTPIPASASPRLRAFLQAQRTRRAQGAVKEANADLAELGKGLKAAIATARASLSTNKQAIKGKYDQALQTEQKNIKAQIKGAPTAKPKAKANANTATRKSATTTPVKKTNTTTRQSPTTVKQPVSIIRKRKGISANEALRRKSVHLSRRN